MTITPRSVLIKRWSFSSFIVTLEISLKNWAAVRKQKCVPE